MRHQPARTLGKESPQENDDQRQQATDDECQSPSHIGRKQPRIENDDRSERAKRSANPKAAVDDQVGLPAPPRRHEFLHGGIDRSVLAADAGAGCEAEQRERSEIPRQSGQHRGNEIDADGDGEQPLPPQPIGEIAEEQRAQHRVSLRWSVDEPVSAADSEPTTVTSRPSRIQVAPSAVTTSQ